MNKLKTLSALGLSLTMLVGVVGCGETNDPGNQYSDYYTFDTGAISSELLYGSEMKIDPVIKNLGTVVDANYNVSVTLDGKDVTSSVYNKETKMFAPAQQSDAIGTYTFNLTIVDADGKNVLDENGKTFSTSFNVDYCIMDFVPKANAGTGVTVDNTNPLSPVIHFDESYAAGAANTKKDSQQYRLTGVSFAGDYEIVYKIKANAISENDETRFFFGVDRTDDNKRDDNIAINIDDGRLSSWFFQDAGQASGDDWSGTGWTHTTKSVQSNVLDGKSHLIGFTRICSTTNAYYVVTWDGEYFTTLNVKGNWTDTVGCVWVESINVEGSIEVASFRTLAKDTTGPAVVLNYEDIGVNSELNLNNGIVVMDEVYNATSNIAWDVRDPEGEAATVTKGVVSLNKGGVYTINCTVTDLKGNSTTTSTKLNVYSNFTVDVGFDKVYKKGSEITANVKLTAEDSAMLAATQAKLYKGGVEVANAITGSAADGFKFTPSETGVYTLHVDTVTAGREISKDFEFVVSGSQATGDIDMSRNTTVAGKGVNQMIYGEGADTFKVYKGETLTEASDVTADIVGTYVTKTLETAKTYTYFRPTEAGTYFVVAQKGTGDATTTRVQKINVVETAHNLRIYDNEKIDTGNGRLDLTVWGNDEILYLGDDNTADTSKVVYDGRTLGENNFAIEFKVTDMGYNKHGAKIFFSTYMGGWGRDFFLEGRKHTAEGMTGYEFWGFGAQMPGTGWIEYQWQAFEYDQTTQGYNIPKTDNDANIAKFVPDNDSNYEGEGYQYAFRPSSEYADYLIGTHTYRVEYIMTATAGVYDVHFYIDGRPEATHRGVAYGSNKCTCVVLNTQGATGLIHGITFIDLNEAAD